ELVEFLHAASVRMEGVVAGVRKYMAVARQTPRFEALDLHSPLTLSLGLLDQAISESGATIETDSLPVVIADADQMVALFEILIGNSIRFCSPQAPPRVRISSRQVDGFAAIAIEDNGIGVDPESTEAAFLPFKRLNGREYPGAGLGLAVARLIVETHGGSIRMDALESGGSRVEFLLPRA